MRKILIRASFFLCFSFALWSGLWFLAAGEMKKQAEILIAQAEKDNVLIVARKLSVGNYPFIPEIVFAGRIDAYGYAADIPLILARGFFLPGKILRIRAPEGISLLAPADAGLWSLNKLFLDVVVPPTLPAAFAREDLKTWKDSGGAIDIKKFSVEKESLSISGSGRFSLDDNLQPEGKLAARAQGHLSFLEWLLQNDYVGGREAMLSGAVLAGLSKTDPETGQSFIDTFITLQNRTFFVGALQLLDVPEILWPWRG